MKILLVILLILSPKLISQDLYYTFSELRGMEDYNGNTHLFYRLLYESDTDISYHYENSIYHLDLQNGSDSLFLFDYDKYSKIFPYESYTRTRDFDFWDNDPHKFIAAKTGCATECLAYFPRFDTSYNTNWNNSLSSSGMKIKISPFNDSLLYASIPEFVKSFDGGKTWSEPDMEQPLFFADVSTIDSSVYFVLNQQGKLYKTNNGGEDYYFSDSLELANNWFDYIPCQMLFDSDGKHIYRVAQVWNGDYYFSVSSNSGEPGSWTEIMELGSKILIEIDKTQPGVLFLAKRNEIYRSTDFGATFETFKVLDRKVEGMYKKPGSDLLYAATKYNLYEITSGTTSIIKHLSLDPSTFDYYPLAVGNKWWYKSYNICDGCLNNTVYASTVEVAEEVMLDTLSYKKIIVSNKSDYYLRIDFLSGRVYKKESLNEDEYLFDDLLAEPGDTISGWIRFHYLNSVVNDTIFGQNTQVRSYSGADGGVIWHEYKLYNGFGIVWESYSESNSGEYYLTGARINGEIFGDTVITGIEDVVNIPKEFALSQNYPNPFNPSTIIKYSVPYSSNIELNIYDVLGKEVAVLVNEEKPMGEYEVEFNASDLSSGVYFYTLKAGEFKAAKKLVLLK